MAELRATPQSPGWAWLAEKLGATRRALDEAFPLAPGSFLLQGTPEEVREWSYGNYPLRLQHPYAGRTASRMPSVQPGRGQALADTALLAAELTPVVGPLARVARSTAASVQSTPPLGAIKAPGGNWLAGQVEKTIAPIKQAGTSNTEILAPGIGVTEQSLGRGEAINKWLDSKLTKYIKNEMATERDPLRLQADRWATEQQPKLLAEKQKQIDKAQADFDKAQRERGQPPEELTRSRARILELEKERDFIAARKGLHFAPRPTPELYRNETRHAREMFGFPRDPIASSETGKLWEDLADRYLGQRSRAGEIISPNYYLRPEDASRVYAENPWLFKVPPETDVQMLNRGLSQQDTGFKHMADELRNALNPDSGLPKELQVSAKDLDKMTVPQVADLVDRIDAYRAVQKAEADKLAAQKSIVVHKEYPESEQGLRWVEMKPLENPDTQLPENWTVKQDQLGGKNVFYVVNDKGENVVKGAGFDVQDSPEQAIALARKELSKKDLEEALKYEGDIMQHCVGGYCPDVIEGRSRIFSLRDSSGRPHVTIEVAPQPRNVGVQDIPDKYLEDALLILSEKDPDIEFKNPEAIDRLAGDLWRADNPDTQRIVQIKGLNNRKPADEYLPYVQDFVRSGQWSDVKDMEHTGLYAVDPASELSQVMTQAGRDLPKFVTDAELTELLNEFMPGRFSRGGAVRGYDPSAIERIVQDFETNPPRYAEGGGVQAPEGSAELQAIQRRLAELIQMNDPRNLPEINRLLAEENRIKNQYAQLDENIAALNQQMKQTIREFQQGRATAQDVQRFMPGQSEWDIHQRYGNTDEGLLLTPNVDFPSFEKLEKFQPPPGEIDEFGPDGALRRRDVLRAQRGGVVRYDPTRVQGVIDRFDEEFTA